jgi:hypothetical protein
VLLLHAGREGGVGAGPSDCVAHAFLLSEGAPGRREESVLLLFVVV